MKHKVETMQDTYLRIETDLQEEERHTRFPLMPIGFSERMLLLIAQIIFLIVRIMLFKEKK